MGGLLLVLCTTLPDSAPAQCPTTFLAKWGAPGSGTSQFNSPHNIAMDAAGNVYVTDTANSRVQKFGSSGAYLAQWGTSGSGDSQFNNLRGIARDAAGNNLYVADLSNHRIQKFTTAGIFVTKWGVFGAGNSQFSSPSDVATDGSGNVYVVDSGNNRIQKFTAAGAYLSQWGTTGSGDGQFTAPQGIATDAAGNVYVTEFTNHRVQKFTSTGAFLLKWGSFGTGNAQFNRPNAVTVDPAGDVYVSDFNNGRIQKFTSTGAYLCQWGSPGSGNGQFELPNGMVTDAAGNLYVVEQTNNRVQYFGYIRATLAPGPSLSEGNSGLTQFNFTVNLSGPAPSTVTVNYQTSDGTATVADNDYQAVIGSIVIPAAASSGIITVNVVGDTKFEFTETFGVTITSVTGGAILGSPSSATGTILNDEAGCIPNLYLTKWGTPGSGNGQFNGPYGVTVNSGDSVYVTDDVNDRVEVFTSGGTYLTKWGTSGTGNGQLDRPLGVATDDSGYVYVSEYLNHRVQKFSRVGAYNTKWGNLGSGNGQFQNPLGVVRGGAGDYYVADRFNHRIQKFTAGGAFLAKWGSPGSGNGQFNRPAELAVYGGLIYVSDEFNNRIQVFNTSGGYLNQWGTPGSGNGQFNGPTGLAVDGSGRIYVADYGNHRIQVFTSTGAYLTQWGTFGSGDGQFNGPNDIAFDSAGNIYVTDTGNNRVQKFGYIQASLAAGPSLSEGNGGLTSFNFTVNLSGPAPSAVTINYQTSDGTARVANNDYQAATGSIVIPATASSGIITVNVVGDNAFEVNETFGVAITGVTSCTALGSPSSATGTILNDDADVPTGCTVLPWDSAPGRVFICPGVQNNVDQVTISVTGQLGPMVGAAVLIDVTDCGDLCIDSPSNLSGTTDVNGQLVLNPRVGGCETCNIRVRVNGTVMKTFTRFLSPDWDGTRADGRVDSADSTYFASHYVAHSYQPCLDYDGNGTLNLVDFSKFAACFTPRSSNTVTCVPPNAAASSVTPWDSRGRVFVCPGTQTNADEVTIIARDADGVPIANAAVVIDVSSCGALCLDSPSNLTGTTDANGRLVLNPRVGGCEVCDIQVRVNGALIRTFARIVSPDWDGARADGHVDCVDLAFITAHVPGSEPCADYNGSGLVDASDLAIFASCLGGTNTASCPGACPVICTQPTSQQVTAGQAGVLTVAASGSSPLTYQWRRNGQDIPDATLATLEILAAQCCDAGGYEVEVTNACGTVVSQVAELTVAASSTSGSTYFRRSATCAIAGSYSLWAGVTGAEATSLGYVTGQGYGNGWDTTVEKTFNYSGVGNVTLAFRYAVDAEAGYDYSYAAIDTSGVACGAASALILVTYTGTVSGSESLVLTPGVDLPTQAGPVTIFFRVMSDAAGSDQDGIVPSNCGHSAFDNIRLSGAILDYSDFETGDGGWVPLCSPLIPVVCSGPNTWVRLTGAGAVGSPPAPIARTGPAMAEDASGRIVLFGGQQASGGLDDTWLWDGTSWQYAAQAVRPAARGYHAMAFDAARNRVVLFGGANGAALLGDTWEWDGNTWTLVSSSGPSARRGHVMAYDPLRGRVVLFGGNDGALKGDTWTWNGTLWTLVSNSGPTPRQAAAAAYDAGLGMVVLFGGEDAALPPVPRDDTWEWDGASWVQADVADPALHAHPGLRAHHAMTYALDCARPTLFGGGGVGGTTPWRWRGAEWINEVNPGPGARRDFAMAYDRIGQRVMLFGGSDYSSPAQLLGDTWELCGPCDMEAAPLDARGNVILPPNIDPGEPVTYGDVDEVNGLVKNLYPAPQYDTLTDLWYKALPCPAAVGGKVPAEASLNGVADSLAVLYPGVTPGEIADSLGAWENQILNEVQNEPDSLLLRGPVTDVYVDPATPHVPCAGQCYVFGGRDIVFVHGFQPAPIVAKILNPSGPAAETWHFLTSYPANVGNPSFYNSNLYWKKRANEYWERHIQKFLRERGIMNRYLIVAWPSTQRLEVGALAMLTQVGDAMKFGTGVVDPSECGDTTKFGTPSYVVISHSTGGLVTDVAMAAAHNFPNILHAKFISDHCKGQIALHDAFSGSGFAPLAIAVSRAANQVLLPWACDAVKRYVLPGLNLPGCPSTTAIEHSVLRDLVPRVTQWKWGLFFENSTPVRTLTVSGAHPSAFSPLKNIIHPGYDDGTLTVNSEAGNPNFSTLWPVNPTHLWPSGFLTFPALGLIWNYDMGINPVRAIPLFLDMAIDPLIVRQPIATSTGSWLSAGAIPYLSPTGMLQSVLLDPDFFTIGGTPLGLGGTNRIQKHYSFLLSPSEHADSNPSFDDSVWEYPNYKKVFGSTPNENGEETRVITSREVYAPYLTGQDANPEGLLNELTVPNVEEAVRGRDVHFKWFGHTIHWWIWQRAYYRLEGWNGPHGHEMDYVYRSVLSNGSTYPDLACLGTIGVAPGGPVRPFELVGVGPNPSSGVTRMEFAVPARGVITVGVFDVSGRAIRTIRTSSEAGLVVVAWDGRADDGSPAVSGIYFLRGRFEPTSGGAQTIRARVVLLR